jgi:ubiquinone/menaquinone biosynthesis C-methylase UbiE
MSAIENNHYYKQVGDYYDLDALNFEKRYWENVVLQNIRTEFRNITDQYPSKNILEIGYGPGLDLIYFAQQNKTANIYGIDISKGMYDCTDENIRKNNIQNISIAVGSVEDIREQFNGKKFDMIYVFFGALNTVEDLKQAAKDLEDILEDNGRMVLTFVNKWYMKGILAPLIKLKFRTAFARLRKIWGGYSTSKFLPSKCYSLSEIKNSFRQFTIELVKGYSITYPAWYDGYKFRNKKVLNFLWNTDRLLSKTFMKGWGEYSLFVFKKS